MSDRIDTDAVRGQFPDHGQSHERYLLHRLCDEVDRLRAALRQIRDRRRGDGLPTDHAIARAALAEGDTERPETCPRCRSNSRSAYWYPCSVPTNVSDWHGVVTNVPAEDS